MHTVQVRGLSEFAYNTYRQRASTAGKSLQAYLHDFLEAEAQRTPKEEALAAMRATLDRDPSPGVTRESILADLEAERR